jgi:hypothetical protein
MAVKDNEGRHVRRLHGRARILYTRLISSCRPRAGRSILLLRGHNGVADLVPEQLIDDLQTRRYRTRGAAGVEDACLRQETARCAGERCCTLCRSEAVYLKPARPGDMGDSLAWWTTNE